VAVNWVPLPRDQNYEYEGCNHSKSQRVNRVAMKAVECHPPSIVDWYLFEWKGDRHSQIP
jgi:hypothetical protein